MKRPRLAWAQRLTILISLPAHHRVLKATSHMPAPATSIMSPTLYKGLVRDRLRGHLLKDIHPLPSASGPGSETDEL